MEIVFAFLITDLLECDMIIYDSVTKHSGTIDRVMDAPRIFWTSGGKVNVAENLRLVIGVERPEEWMRQSWACRISIVGFRS